MTIIGILCLTNTLNAADDFFEFVVVDEPEEILIEESAEEVISDTTAVTEADEAAEEDTETGMSAVVPMVSGKAVTAESATAPETAGSVSAATAPATPAASFAPAATSANTASSAASTTTSTSAGNTRNASTSSTSNVSAEANVENAGEMESTVYEPEAEAEDDEIEETPVDEKAPSRSVTIKKRQYLDVTYPGEGWLFMGDEYNSKALSFKGREQKGNSTLMKFYSDRAGEALLHFCKQDILTDTYIHDYLLVTVDKTTGNRQHIEAPEYIPAPAVNKDADIADIGEEQLEEETEETEVSEVAEVSEQEENEDEESESEINSIGGISLADEPDVVFSFGDGIDFSDGGDDDYYQQLIDEANDAFFAGRGQEAVEKAQIVIDDGSYFSDEALYIQAQVYETDQALLDVNKAYGLYKTIVDYYPESSLWSKASKRVTYLERYYYSIR